MNSKTRLNALMMGAMLMGGMDMPGMPYRSNDNGGKRIEPDTDGEKKRKDDAYKAVLKSKGVQEFIIEGVSIMARSEKKAYEKFKNRQ